MLFKPAPISLAVAFLVTASLLTLPSHLLGGPGGHCVQREATTLCVRYVEGQGFTATVDIPDGGAEGRRRLTVSHSDRWFRGDR